MEVDIMEGAELNTVIARCIGYPNTHNFVGDVVEAVKLWDLMRSQLWNVNIYDRNESDDRKGAALLERGKVTVWAYGPTWMVALGRAALKALTEA
jgi:hypothetical protein